MTDQIPVKNVTPVKVHRPDPSKHEDRYRPRSRIYVRAVEGTLETFRRLFGLIFLGIFAILPWLSYNGNQAILLDIGAQRFNIFGDAVATGSDPAGMDFHHWRVRAVLHYNLRRACLVWIHVSPNHLDVYLHIC